MQSIAVKGIPQRQYTLRYYRVHHWPELTGDCPLELLGRIPGLALGELAGDLTPQTTLSRDLLFRHDLCERIKVEQAQRVTRAARFGLHNLGEFNLRYEFAAYRYRNSPKLYVHAGRTNADGALRRIRDHTRDPHMQFARRSVDVAAFAHDHRGRVDASYFCGLDLINVRAATISGENVRESSDYHQYDGRGNLPAASFYFDVNGVPRRITATQDGLVQDQATFSGMARWGS